MEQLKLDAFMGYRFLSSPKYAPDGSRAAFVAAECDAKENGYKSSIWLYEGGKTRRLTWIGKEKNFIWDDDETLLFPAARTDEEKKRQKDGENVTFFYALNVHGGEAEPRFSIPLSGAGLRKIEDGLYAVTADIDAEHPDEYLMTSEEKAALKKEREENKDYEVLDEAPFWMNGGGMVNKQRTALFLFRPAAENKLVRITRPKESLGAWEVFGNEIFWDGAEYETKMPVWGCHIKAYDLATGEIRTVFKDERFGVGNLLAAEDAFFLLGGRGEKLGLNENNKVWKLDPAGGEAVIVRDEQYSMYGSVGSDCRFGGGKEQEVRKDELFYVTTREGDAHLYKVGFDGEDHPLITKPGSIDCFTLQPDGNKVLMVALYDMKLQELYEADLADGSIRQITDLNNRVLENVYTAIPEPLFTESCGLSIGGWVMKPKDYDPSKKYPAVYDIHGGPKTVYGPVFYHEMQYWANLGYFVFYCNPKGSDGRDNEFSDIRGHYGETDYQNLMDFMDAVLDAYPAIDPARVCETGGSYGGFMTNWIIGHTDRFVCAASQRSIANWLSFYGVSDIGPYFAADQNDAEPLTEPEKLWAHSPLKYAYRVKTPTLFIHSDEDYRCPLCEGLQMYSALVDRGIDARLVMFHGENHELSRSGKPLHRVRRLKEITAWFEKYSGE